MDAGAASAAAAEQQQQSQLEPSIDTDKLSYEIFSILESKFLFGYDDDNKQLWVPRSLPPGLPEPEPDPAAGAVTASPPVAGNIKSQRGKVCILSIDGGAGMRGILPGRVLAYLEQALRSKSGDPDARISDYFDVAAGTGVGGIFTAMLFASRDGHRPIFPADDTWRLLVDKGHRFFVHKKGGNRMLGRMFCSGGDGAAEGRMRESRIAVATAGVERAMKEAFGEELTLRDTVKPVLIPCYDLCSGAPFLFSRADALEADGFDFRLWEVCRATWAEPGRFEPVDMRSIDGTTRCIGVDGGLTMSNPATAAITHVLHNKQEFPFVRGVEDLLVLSLGCGGAVSVATPSAASAEEGRAGCGGKRGPCCVSSATAASPSSTTVAAHSAVGRQRQWDGYEQVRRWSAREWARPIARIASDGAADLVDHAVALAFGECRNSNYVRIQVDTSSLCPLGLHVDSDPSPGNVKMLLGVADEMLKQKNVESTMFGGRRIGEQTNSEKLDWFAGELVVEHQRRSCRIAPTVAFKQAARNSTTTSSSQDKCLT
ncbi:hypothetical protein Taro_056226 [Colocasia esculenta]|uniref:Patatin n=1 Tax=Colocasia esculenta TaxID=4460 RepID=A0A843XVV4_COLES|nr:hypothetical protein [Colocasia esculenta]